MRQPRLERPYVTVNMAMTADGKIATANRVLNSFGSPRDHLELHALRATADAILCGARTVSAPGVTLDAGGPRFERLRLRHGLTRHPLAVVVSGRARVDPDAGVFRSRSLPPILLVSRSAPARTVAALSPLALEVRAFGESTINLADALAWLHAAHGVRRMVCEGGAELNDAMLRAGLIDEVRLTLCPALVGGRRAPTLAEGRGFDRLADAFRLVLSAVRRRGDELFLTYRRA